MESPLIHKSIEQKSDTWFKMRGKKMVTSSDMSIFFGLSGEVAREQHYQEKIHNAIPKFWGNDYTCWGNYAEPLAANAIHTLWASHEDKSYDFDVGFAEPTKGPLAGFVGSSPDGLYADDEHSGCVEIKCPYSLKTPELIPKIPLSYWFQCQQHMYCTGRNKTELWYYVPYFRASSTHRLKLFMIYYCSDWIHKWYEPIAAECYKDFWSKGFKPTQRKLRVSSHRSAAKKFLLGSTVALGWYYPEMDDGYEIADVGCTASDVESEPGH